MENLIQALVIIASIVAIVVYATIAITGDMKQQANRKKKANLYNS